ncbi:hypothetical protein C0J52_10844 [Blattella germanica]|nr:hypothetical protein C0J52_10844 [Blattella germanica]
MVIYINISLINKGRQFSLMLLSDKISNSIDLTIRSSVKSMLTSQHIYCYVLCPSSI